MISPDPVLSLAGGSSPSSPAFPLILQGSQSPFADLDSATAPPLCIPAVSCSLSRIPNLDTCCINSPSGHFLSTQFWDTQPALGANDTWTLHGLWPDYCTGGFDAFCNSSRSLSGPDIKKIISDADANGTHTGLLSFMNENWQSTYNDHSTLWSHEWNKHGTCISTMEPNCYDRDQQQPNAPELIDSLDILDYFTHATLLYSSLPTFQYFADHDIFPSHDETYTLEQLHNAIRSSPHGVEATIHCRNHNELSEIWYHFNARGSLRNAMDSWWDGNKMWSSWLPTEPDGQKCKCPDEGIRYLPKGGAKHNPPYVTRTATHTATHTATTAPTATHGPSNQPFVGKGRLLVKILPSSDSDSTPSPNSDHPTLSTSTSPSPIPRPYTGCLIRHGTWYNAPSLSSCAIFTADDDAKTSLSTPPLSPSTSNDTDTSYHLFTLASRFAPCSFIPASASLSYLACRNDLQFQTIFSNNATGSAGHEQDASRLTVGREHQGVFYAREVPGRDKAEVLWTGEPREDGSGEGDGVRVEIHWVGV